MQQAPVSQSIAVSGPTRNEKILFWASFFTLIAEGMGFSVRGGILLDWSRQFGFTQSDLGGITGGGLTGFGITIIAFSIFADRVGYGRLMVTAFLLHFSSAVVTLAATPIFHAYGKEAAYQCLYWGMFLFALGNGTCEAVINPLTATMFPRRKTHWLNILHAGWPAGLLLGALVGVFFKMVGNVRWEVQMSMFLIPTLAYGVMMVGRHFPPSETRASGITFITMLKEFASPLLLFLLVLHALQGYMELGTDSWISNITGSIMESPSRGLMLFMWTSALMLGLRFFAGPIVHRISPIGLLFCGAATAAVGLLLLGHAATAQGCLIAATIYGVGKTFNWPTMLGVVSERFPRGGALTLGVMGGVGMLSAGLLGSPGIGYTQDHYASHYLERVAPHTYERYMSDRPKGFLFFHKIVGLDGSKVAILSDGGAQLQRDLEIAGSKDPHLNTLNAWWQQAKAFEHEDGPPVKAATLHGDKKAMTAIAVVPTLMALGFLILLIYFRTIGGYKAQVIAGHAARDEKFLGGVEGTAGL
ncbi:MAG: MFS transporter [Alphaproteobacteria bacterium]|nr:MFS transporter [Alphaproteobacteria bacterium]